MKLESQTIEGVLVFRPVGRLDSTSSPELEQALVESLGAGTTRLIFDFSPNVSQTV